jgi:hypothetical protein
MGTRLESLLVAPHSNAFSVTVDGIGENDPRTGKGRVVSNTLTLIRQE